MPFLTYQPALIVGGAGQRCRPGVDGLVIDPTAGRLAAKKSRARLAQDPFAGTNLGLGPVRV
jgi:hypothetical protein